MRLVFVNHAHPDIAHVSGMRLGYFAKEMARRGHQVVLLTCALPGSADVDPTGPRLSALLTTHDWAQPLVIAIPPIRRRALELIRQNRLPAPLRRALTLWQFVAHGGMFADWHKATDGAAAQLVKEFRPELVWGTFGNTTNLALAQRLARRAGCVWVMDIKDNWEAFVPAALRRWMARRFCDAAGITSNSQHHGQVASRWLGLHQSEVIYSGVAEAFFEGASDGGGGEGRDLLLVGSVYDDRWLSDYLAVVREWVGGLHAMERQAIRIVYVGSDARRVTGALNAGEPWPCAVKVMSQLSIAELAALARGAFANTFLSASFTFHHKLLELLVCGQPLICYPGISDESHALAARCSTSVAFCETPKQLRDGLTTAWSKRTNRKQEVSVPAWRWSDFAVNLESFFQRVVQERQA